MTDLQSLPKPTVSVVIPAYNRAGSIGRAVASVGGKPDGSYELIVVDDGSTDDTVTRAREAVEIHHGTAGRVVVQENGGPGAARNRGAAEASGDYLAFLDSDDFWLPGTLQTCLDALREGEAPALVFLQTVDIAEGQPVDEAGGQTEQIRTAGFLEAVRTVPSTRYGSCNVIVRRDVFERLGGFTRDVTCSEDTDLFMRAADAGPCLVLSGAPLVAHVQGEGERLTGSFPAVLRGFEFMLDQDRAGYYPDPKTSGALKDRMLAQCAVHTALGAFAAGRVGTAYRLYLQNLPRMVRSGYWRWLLRLPLVPALALLRPASYRMRWKKAG